MGIQWRNPAFKSQSYKSWWMGVLLFVCGPAFSNTLVYCSEASPDYFNPQLSLSGSAFDATSLIYSRLVEFGPQGKKFLPGLAEKWTVSKDGRIYTFYLRKNVSFHSRGEFKPTRFMNADDVVWSFERQKNKNHPFHQVGGGGYRFFHALGLPDLLLEVRKKNDHEVQFILKTPHVVFLSYLAMEFANILSQEYGAWLTRRGQKERIDFEPVGTGPFIFKKYIKDSLIRYVRNDRYYLGPAALEKIVFSITPDPTVRFQKLKKGECHLIAFPQPSDISAMKKHKNIQVMEGITYNVAYLAMNTRKPPLNNLKVRKAIAHALNRELYIKAIYKGLAEVAHSPVPPSLWGYEKINSPSYDLEKSKKLLKEAGHEKGFKIKLWTMPISRPYNPNGKKMGELMQADLKKVGIQAELVTYDWPAYIAKSARGEHDLIQMGWTADIPDPGNFLGTLLSCQAVDSGANLSGWCDKHYDRLIHKAVQWPISLSRRRSLYKRAQRIFSQKIPWVPLAHAYQSAAFSPRLKGYQLKLFGSERFYELSLSD